MRVAISQPRYLPALNYLQRILLVDKFVLLDSVQHQRRAFEHRNRVRDNISERWLSIPIDRTRGSRPQIKDMKVVSNEWIDYHKQVLRYCYRHAPFFSNDVLDNLYQGMESLRLFVDIAELHLKRVFELLEIPVNLSERVIRSSLIDAGGTGSELIAKICTKLGADEYVSGPNGRNYLKPEQFSTIRILYHEYDHPVYCQHSDRFIPWLAWVDCFFNEGPKKTRELISVGGRLLES